MESLSPINKTLIEKVKLNNNQTSKNIQVQTPVPKLSADSVELSTKTQKQGLIDKIKSNKKLLITGTSIAALAVGIAIGIRTGRADRILKRSDGILNQGQKQYNEVKKLIDEGAKNSFSNVFDESDNLIRNFIDDENGHKLMQEFSGENIIRRTQFNPEDLSVDFIQSGYKKLKNGIEYIKENFEFKNGFLDRFSTRNEVFPNQTHRANEVFCFKNNKLKQYFKGYNFAENQVLFFERLFQFENGELTFSKKGCKS